MNMTLIIGSSSNAGRPLVEALSVSGERIRCATRNPAQYKAPANGEAVRFDYQDPATYEAALEGTNRVFAIAPPAADPAGVVIPFLQQAARNGRKIVLMTAMGTEFEENGPLRRVEIALEKSGAPFVILRPNWFMDNFHGMWLPAIRHAGVIAVPASDSLTSFIDARDIAACAASALATDRFDGGAYTLTGPAAVSYLEAASTLSKAAGREIHYVPIEEDAFVKSVINAGAPEQLASLLAALFEGVRAGHTEALSKDVRKLSGREPLPLARYASDHAAAWAA